MSEEIKAEKLENPCNGCQDWNNACIDSPECEYQDECDKYKQYLSDSIKYEALQARIKALEEQCKLAEKNYLDIKNNVDDRIATLKANHQKDIRAILKTIEKYMREILEINPKQLKVWQSIKTETKSKYLSQPEEK